MKDNFIAYTYPQAWEILNQASHKKNTKSSPTLYVFAGPNASGKSTLIANLYAQNKLDCMYVNADIFAKTIFKGEQDQTIQNTKSMHYTMSLAELLIKNKHSFVYETVMSHPSKIDIIKQAKQNGFKIVSCFVSTNCPEINLRRLSARASQGGHDVPYDKMIKRYYRSRGLAKDLKCVSDEFAIFDNSQDLSQNVNLQKD